METSAIHPEYISIEEVQRKREQFINDAYRNARIKRLVAIEEETPIRKIIMHEDGRMDVIKDYPQEYYLIKEHLAMYDKATYGIE